MDFGINWLVLPILQVHHKRYIENKAKWDYDNSDLVTLCKDCHNLVHESLEIPLFEKNEDLYKRKSIHQRLRIMKV